jgi:hypothetical protein
MVIIVRHGLHGIKAAFVRRSAERLKRSILDPNSSGDMERK